ncbi:MAG: YkgJ family cysteine cluster protein [Bradymonadales bacterium]|nr:MAG: YkgJ family cysteine cluster protein [Bradymonadales bacterium]
MAEFWEKGIRFECQGSGKCCVSRGGFGFVYVTSSDRKRLAKQLGLKTQDFTRDFCKKSDGFFHLVDGEDGNCVFLKDRRCSVYEGRPTQCRTWPFWPETMNARRWNKDVASFCPGVGKGRVWSKQEIEHQIEIQSKADVER